MLNRSTMIKIIWQVGMCMCVCMYMGAALDVVYGIGGFEDGSIVIWDSRQPHKELASIKLFPEPGMLSVFMHWSHNYYSAYCTPVMCMAMDHDKCSIVAGSPTNNIVKILVSPHLQVKCICTHWCAIKVSIIPGCTSSEVQCRIKEFRCSILGYSQ